MEHSQSTAKSRISASTILRYQVIEIIAYWEGRLTTNHLCSVFDIGRQQASRCISSYLNDTTENNIYMNEQIRGYAPSDNFRPFFTQGHAEEYINLLKLNQNLRSKHNQSTLSLRDIHSVTPPPRFIQPNVMRAISRAISEERELEVEYLSLQNTLPVIRTISPHSLIESALRWQVRAYCETSKKYRDFTLSRFINTPTLSIRATHNIEDDLAWNTMIDLKLEPDTALAPEQIKLIERDYDIKNGELTLPTRLAMIEYTLSSIGIDINSDNPKSNFQPLSLKNMQTLKVTLVRD